MARAEGLVIPGELVAKKSLVERLHFWLECIWTTLDLYTDKPFADAVRQGRKGKSVPYQFGPLEDE